jgi:hypothetical protein
LALNALPLKAKKLIQTDRFAALSLSLSAIASK